MLKEFPGLYTETMANGLPRHCVIIAGTNTKITLQVGKDHPQFREHYHAARAGTVLAATEIKGPTVVTGTVGWLINQFSAAMDQMVRAGKLHINTAKNRMAHLNRMRADIGHKNCNVPRSAILALRYKRMDEPSAAAMHCLIQGQACDDRHRW